MFSDRVDAGDRLARLVKGKVAPDSVVLGLPRGGVPVAARVSAALDLDLDVIVVRKVGLATNSELAMGAVGEGGVVWVNHEVLGAYGVDARSFESAAERERAEVARRVAAIRRVRPRVELAGRTAVIVDDGLATGSTARAACGVARASGASMVVLAVPVAPRGAHTELLGPADEVIVAETPTTFFGVGQFYVDFSPTTEAEVFELLSRTDT